MNSKTFTYKKGPPLPRFTLKEWDLYNREQIKTSLDQQQLSDKILAECDKVQDAFQEKTVLNKREVDFKTEQKIKDSEFNKTETLKHRKDVCSAIDNLIVYNNRIIGFCNYVQDKAIPIAKKCIAFREGRIGIDLCCDEVEYELQKEYQMMQDALPPLRNASQQSNEQIRQLRSSLYFIDRDLEDKDAALNIDKSNLQLNQFSLSLCLYHGFKPLNPAKISIEEWDAFSREIVKKAAKEISATYKLQSNIDFLLSKLIRDLNEQYLLVNESFRRRITETKEIKLKLEKQHSEIIRQANEMTRKIIEIKKSFGLKENFLALAHTRMGNRAQRSGMELCRDLVEANLVNEVAELRKNRDLLQLMISEVQASQRYLLKIQTKLEFDINVKTNTLKIDEVDCLTLRHGIDYHSY